MTEAKECGAHCWETDVRMSKDGELIIFHDDTLKRTTNVATHKAFRNRADRHVVQFTVSELRELDAGFWFLDYDPFGTVASSEVGGRLNNSPSLPGDIIWRTHTYLGRWPMCNTFWFKN